MNTSIAVSALVTAIATVGIFVVTRQTYRLNKTLHEKQKEQDRRFSDLFEAIVIATLLSGGHGAYKDCKKQFLNEYKGGTQVFKE